MMVTGLAVNLLLFRVIFISNFECVIPRIVG